MSSSQPSYDQRHEILLQARRGERKSEARKLKELEEKLRLIAQQTHLARTS
jgi:hypothetical protein